MLNRQKSLVAVLAAATSITAEQLRGNNSNSHERALSLETRGMVTDLAREGGADDWAEKFKELKCIADPKQTGQDSCLGDEDLKCAWCELAQPQQGIDHLCFPAFAKDVITEKGVTSSCVDQSTPKPPVMEEVEGKPDWSKFKELMCLLKQADHDTCLEDDSLHCNWCELVQPEQDVDHGCFPEFLTEQMIEQDTIKNCDPAPSAEEFESELEEGQFDFVKCWAQQDHDSCVGMDDVDCSWCTLGTSIAGLSAVCQPKAYAEAMVNSGIATECSAENLGIHNVEPRIALGMNFASEKTKQSFSYENDLTHALEDNTVDPAFCDPKSPKSLSGYVSLEGSTYDGPGEDKHYFYWFFESRDSSADKNTPLFIWLTGGPGCSSSLALLAENGPCSVNEDGSGTTPNEHSWNNNAHALWLDQPTGVGFSYGKEDDNSEEMVGENAYYFLQSFLQSHPEYQKNPLFITGESYAGHYVPAITHRIWQGNNEKKEGTIQLNLQGMAIGNGLTNPEVQYPVRILIGVADLLSHHSYLYFCLTQWLFFCALLPHRNMPIWLLKTRTAFR
jgi:hypothetical protein